MKRISVFVLLVFLSCGKQVSETVTLSPKEFQGRLMGVPSAVVLDVRTPEELQKGYLQGAVNLDFKAQGFDEQIAELDRSKTYFVYCASGVRSAKAAEKMKALEFKNVYLLDGGIKAWTGEGLPVVTNRTN